MEWKKKRKLRKIERHVDLMQWIPNMTWRNDLNTQMWFERMEAMLGNNSGE